MDEIFICCWCNIRSITISRVVYFVVFVPHLTSCRERTIVVVPVLTLRVMVLAARSLIQDCSFTSVARSF